MAFVGGPRQVGKTTLALALVGPRATERHPAYLNWDDPKVRPALRRGELPAAQRLVVLDEIHKYARWRNLVKGLYDIEKSVRRIVVTGSAHLDHYRKGGDSLAGRFRHFRLHPFSLNEFARATGTPDREIVPGLLSFGGFPEPLMAQSERSLRLWHRAWNSVSCATPKGLVLPDADLQVAATAIHHGLELVSGNVWHLQRIPHLKLNRSLANARAPSE